MIRVLRYPRVSAFACAATLLCAAARDVCVGAELRGWAQALLMVTLLLIAVSLTLLSSRFFVDERGVGVGFLLRVRRTDWEDLTALGTLCCNSRRAYLYGMYRGSSGFLTLLHRAPHCGPWGFVVPMSRRLSSAVLRYCPYEVDFSPMPRAKREGRMRYQWQQAALYAVAMLPASVVAVVTGAVMIADATQRGRLLAEFAPAAGALALIATGLMLFSRLVVSALICPGISERGVCAGRLLYLPWSEVRFGYVHRVARMSGLFLLSRPLADLERRGAPPVACLSMPDTSTVVLAYVTYCPNAPRDEQMV